MQLEEGTMATYGRKGISDTGLVIQTTVVHPNDQEVGNWYVEKY